MPSDRLHDLSVEWPGDGSVGLIAQVNGVCEREEYDLRASGLGFLSECLQVGGVVIHAHAAVATSRGSTEHPAHCLDLVGSVGQSEMPVEPPIECARLEHAGGSGKARMRGITAL